MRPLFALLLLLGLVACGQFPRDPEGTLERIVAEKRFRAGFIAGAAPGDNRPAVLLTRLGERTGARPQVESGPAEALLARLEAGELDIVLGDFASTTPWSTSVSLSPPIGIRLDGGHEVHTVAAMRNGENGWIGLVEREARKVGGAPR